MSVDPPDYEAREKQMWRENATNVISRLNEGDKDLLKRISTYNHRFDYSTADIEKKIRTDKMFAASFAKEPRRQGIHEKIAAEWIICELGIDVEALPKNGDKAYYVTSDGVIARWARKQGRPPSKSLDFRWEAYGKIFYAMHKYTKEGGGNQDSQFKEMCDLLSNFQKASDRDIVLIVIVDGAYYTEKRMITLRHYVRQKPPQSYATAIEGVKEIVVNCGKKI